MRFRDTERGNGRDRATLVIRQGYFTMPVPYAPDTGGVQSHF